MSALISIVQRSGLGYSATDVAKLIFYFLPIDSNVEDSTDYPIGILSDQTVYSYEMWLRFRCDVASETSVSNFKIWTAGALPANQNITLNSTEVASYSAPVDTLSTKGTRVDFADHREGDEISVPGTLVNINDTTSYVVLQLEVSSTATAGSYTINAEIFFSYDEV